MKKLFLLASLILFFSLPAFGQAGQAGHSVSLTWSDSDSSNPAIAYNVYRAPGACSAGSVFAKITLTPVSTLSYVDLAVILGNSYCYVVTAVLNGQETGFSNQAGATVSLPSTPVLSPPVSK